MQNTDWIYCPVCGNKTRGRIREDTILKNYPLYCPKCKQQTLITLKLSMMSRVSSLRERR